MKTLVGSAIALSLTLCMALTAADKAAPIDPGYDTRTVITLTAKVTEVREVSKDQPLAGVHVMVQLDSQALDIYVGPTEFVKVFDVAFAKGDEIRVIGSKVNFEGSAVVLAREVTLGSVTLVCRDKDGSPLWKYFIKVPVG
jgi:hypothetical protein